MTRQTGPSHPKFWGPGSTRPPLNQELVSPILPSCSAIWPSGQTIRERLNSATGRRWIVPDPSPAARVVLAQLHVLVGQAVRRHDAAALAQLERAIGFATRGHTAGEAALMERLAKATQRELKALIRTLPREAPKPDHLEVKLTGLVLFGPAKTETAAVASPSCPSSKPLSSISTGP